MAPTTEVEPTTTIQKVKLVGTNILPMGFVEFMVVGSIIFGLATPTEATAIGVLGAILLATALRAMPWGALRTSVDGTVRVAAMVFFILKNSTVFSQLFAFSSAAAGMLEWATSFDINRLLILLVMFMDAVSIMLITVLIFFSLAQHLGFDLVWFGLVWFELFVLITIEIAGTTLFQVANAAFAFLI